VGNGDKRCLIQISESTWGDAHGISPPMAVVDPIKQKADVPQDALDDAHAESVLIAFKALLAGLSAEQQERIRVALFPSNSAPRAGQVLGTILKLVPRDRAFTIEEVKKSVEAEGVQATAKAIYNALGYLTRKKKITRVGHGRYMVDGVEIITTEELDAGPPTRDMIDDY
jgi:hypothetical protein